MGPGYTDIRALIGGAIYYDLKWPEMDHILLPRGPVGFRFEVPVLSTQNYDGGDFFTYPNRQGWGPRRVCEWQAIFEAPSIEFKAFLQRWLYFGLIHVRLGPFDIKTTFVSKKRDRHGCLILKTESLPTIALHSVKTPISPKHELRGVLAVQMVDMIQLRLSKKWLSRRKRANFSRPGMWMILRRRGCCPFDILPMTKQFNVSALMFMVNITRPNPEQEHRMIHITSRKKVAPSGEKLCNPMSCHHRQLSDNTYQTRHVDGCLGCEDIVADPTTILRRGTFPLIVAIDTDSNDTEAKFVAAEQNMPYIAISHVWSDGLGNLLRNALPRCQLLRLSDMIRNLPGRVVRTALFWFDTLCVPPDSAEQHEEQGTALQLMRQVYQNATAVLVLDSWLLSTPCSQMHDAEMMMRIFTANWDRCLWTYPKGALAWGLLFQFQDGTCDLDAVFRRHQMSLDIAVSMTVWPCIEIRYRSLRGFRRIKDQKEAFAAIMAAMAFRSTSVAIDEALCLASLLDLDSKPLLAENDPQARMELLWSMLDAVPVTILLNIGAKLDKPGLRWAPQTLLLSPSKVHPETGEYYDFSNLRNLFTVPMAKPTPRGLRIQLHGIVFLVSNATIGSEIIVKGDKGKFYRILHEYRRLASEKKGGALGEPRTVTPRREFGTSYAAFVSWSSTERLTRDPGLLVAVVEHANRVIYARNMGKAFCMEETRDMVVNDLRDLNKRAILVDSETGFLRAACGEERGRKQVWCID
ncbi:uncharacterized protein BO80DRAFT_438823 [Aspergillus ibericus CBS 121593]|uniref:Heterokaryon incompatibility domain-containing protein n=1 Tax=Aspergillus ibericus CBS 121593 TaxID=1448316 RepID=A0A395GL26_9EURO|nr:hypothetical protein BO80DRAFT_438823 [Aspergillus ibericus CBS 121593]RAK96211.1 hypothetical protein BO80DRAFT_438823 [Aspergillus ibericus CBS 121593]